MKSSRRDFFRTSLLGAAGATGGLAALEGMQLLSHAADQCDLGGYKALVCLYLGGGNDANNLIVPHSQTDYDQYRADRGNLALDRDTLLSINPATADGRDWALHPAAVKLQSLFAQQKLAILGNVGTLLYPTTRADWLAESVAVPPQLFSHNDQSLQWQTSWSDQLGKLTGWGGRIADLVACSNDNASVSMSISINGSNTFQIGNEVFSYQVSTSGAPELTGFWGPGQNERRAATRNLYDLPNDNLFQRQFAELSARAIDTNTQLQQKLDATPAPAAFPAADTSYLTDQFRMVAHLIKIRAELGVKRQIFFVERSGFDTHEEQINAHTTLLNDVSESMNYFQLAMAELGLENDVTTFTASDFGRTYTSNGRGSDHGWGSHSLIMGGAVQGGDIYGNMPVLAVNGPDDTESGRWIPTTAVDQMSATLASWFGVSPSNLPLVVPNIGRFASSDLGFMA